jgi:hypothetical protein
MALTDHNALTVAGQQSGGHQAANPTTNHEYIDRT